MISKKYKKNVKNLKLKVQKIKRLLLMKKEKETN